MSELFEDRAQFPDDWTDGLELAYQNFKADPVGAMAVELKHRTTGKRLGDFPECMARAFFREALEGHRTGRLVTGDWIQ
jgi:hypothetical protein